jgi:hypothetical protein
MDRSNFVLECIQNGTPIVFSKYGDGEYLCAVKYTKNITHAGNCDNDTYTVKLSNAINESFKYIVKQPNSFIGKFGMVGHFKGTELHDYWENLADGKINWICYHTLIFNAGDVFNDGHALPRLKIYKAIKESPRKKIIICNPLMIKMQILLNADHVVLIPFNNWFDDKFDEVLKQVSDLIGTDGNHMVLTSCGMSAKVLVAELHKKYPNGIYIDIGSALDCLCTKRGTRSVLQNYEHLYQRFNEYGLIPDNWNDSKYDYIYPEASVNLGLHLPK